MKTLGSHSISKSFSGIRISLLIYFLLSVGVSLQISGSNWDIIWHGIGNVESFFTPPHSVIYSGVALAIGSIILGVILFSIFEEKKGSRSISPFYFLRLSIILPFPLKLAVIGSLLQ